ncbi:transglutaminaseTgpA domain-containing protein [Streptodolium elevatio]|uniref:TransglutaminaseTgpA domain-containing protein n=1 Tax=Streptodolium elevatio TaxID=3157996 RepID=A0ABV3DF94_9ACTN
MSAETHARGGVAALIPIGMLAFAVGLAFHRVYGLSEVLVPALVASTVPVLLAAALHRGVRAPAPVAAAVSVLIAVAAGCAGYARDHLAGGIWPTPGAAAELFHRLADAPSEALTTVTPVPAGSGGTVLVPAAVWAAAAVGAELVLRTGYSALPVLPATLLFVGAILLATGAPGASLPLVAAFGAVAVVVPALRGPVRRRGQTVAAALLAVLLAVPATVVAPLLPGAGRHAFDPRTHVDTPKPLTVRGTNPLAYISSWLQQPETLLFTVTGPPPTPGGTLYRLAAMQDFDGVSWLPSDAFQPTGGRIPPAAHASSAAANLGPTLRQDVVVGDLTGVFLPAADRPLRVDAADEAVAVDPDTGVLAGTTPLHPGMRYQVTSRPVAHDPRAVEYAAAGDSAAALRLPDRDASGAPIPVVDELRGYAQEATKGAGFPYQQAVLLAAWLRARAALDPQAIPGHSYRHIQYFLGTSKQGTPEQFATAFVLLARTLALPSRVVVGFRVPEADTRDATPVRGGHVLMWAEVQFEGVGWVPFFPTPGVGTTTSAVAPPTEEVPMPAPVPAAPPPAADRAPGRDEVDRAIEDEQHPPAASAPHGGDEGLGAAPVLAAAAAAALLVGGYVVVGLSGPALVRRRRARGSPRWRVRGAWDQVLDDLGRVGPPVPRSATSTEVGGFAAERLGESAGSAALALAGIVDAVSFGGQDASPRVVDDCARHAETVRGGLGPALAGSRRARAADVLGRLRFGALARTYAVHRAAAADRKRAGS